MELLYRPMGGSRIPFGPEGIADKSYCVRMDGRPVFKWAIRLLEETSNAVLADAKLSRDEIDLWVLHQANTRIIDAAVEAMNIDRGKVVIHLDRYGNTSAGSVPIALDESFRAGRIQRGSTILMSGFGAGLSWGTTVFRW
jgi:3-oxoacyl-[acyl-carrier-protein] synthase-3